MNKLKNLKTHRNMKELLENHIHWKVQIFDAESFYNSTTNISENSNMLLFSQICTTCNDLEGVDQNTDSYFVDHLEKFYILVFMFGLVCIFGNGITMAHEIKCLIKRGKTGAKERKVYRMLVLNLCFSDCLMGVYIIIGVITFKVDRENFSLCNFMGFISSLSMQSSATILTIISAYRLKSILFPYKLISVKFSVSLLVMVWFVWAVVMSLPFFNETLFSYGLTTSITINRSDGIINIELHKFISSFQKTVQAVNCTTDEPFCQVLDALPHYLNNEVAIQLLKSFSLVDFEKENPDFLNFYDITEGCIFPIIIEASKPNLAKFSLLFLFFNLIEYLFILIACMIMCINISASRSKKNFPCVYHKNSLEEQRPKIPRVTSENKQVHTRLFVVIVTDLICGMLICLIGVACYFDSFSYSCVINRNFKSWAILIAMLLNPLNSVINPYIYSFHLWKKLLKKCKQRLLGCNL